MIQINLYAAVTAVLNAFFRLWGWLDTVNLIPISENGFTLLDFFFGVIVLDCLLFLIFGFLGWSDGGDSD